MVDSQPSSGSSLDGPRSAVATHRPFRFGAKAQSAQNGREWRDACRRIEDLGYVSVQIPDHLSDQLGTVPALMAAADATQRLQVGPLVAAVDFRNPVVFAKEAATIDLLSEGRFIMGIGAGWSVEDYRIGGMTQYDATTRIARLDEAVRIMRGLWEPERFSLAGQHFSAGETTGMPRPVRRIPMLIGGGGPKVLTVAAKHADIISINPLVVKRRFDSTSLATATPELVDQRMRWVAEAAGPRFGELDFQMHVFSAVVTDDRTAVAAAIANRMGLPAEVVLASPYFQVGTVPQITEDLRAMRERWGISYVAFQPDATEAMAPVVAELSGT